MNIKKYEIKKVIASPIIISLMVIFFIYNGWEIYTNSYINEELKFLNEKIDSFGYRVDEELIQDLERHSKQYIKEANKITKRELNKEYSSGKEFLESKELERIRYGNSLTEDETKIINEVIGTEIYKEVAIENIKAIEKIDIIERLEIDIKSYGLSGEVANIVRKNYKELVPRFEELKSNKEHKNLYFLGSLQTHSLLFRKIFNKVMAEIIILIVLSGALLINYERDNKTMLLVNVTKRGRNLIKDKLCVYSVVSFAVTGIMLGLTLLMYFLVFDYSEIWNIPISSALNWELRPTITWYSLSFKEYLISSIVVVFLISFIFSAITFIIASICKNSYRTFFIFFILFGVAFLMPSWISEESKFLIWSHYNVFILSLNPHMWFREAGLFLTKEHYEIIVIFTNMIVVGVLSCICVKRFKKENI
ncbi:MAG: hypothetical protein ACRC28_13900 [Clostridium sp.]|uniref:hypothetical protein n=1 Tax=Clostridium sp. TaxID=1506 RepID=UPI003F3C4EFF